MQSFYFYRHQQHKILLTDQVQPELSDDFLFVWQIYSPQELHDIYAWQKHIQQQTGVFIHEFHCKDFANLAHPCHFENTDDYDVLIYRKLLNGEDELQASQQQSQQHRQNHNRLHQADVTGDIDELLTTPMGFCLADKALITIIEPYNQIWHNYIHRLEQCIAQQADSNQITAKPIRLPSSSLDLLLRLMSIVSDKYLDVRTPLTQRASYWQMALLQSTKKFTQWQDLFQQTIVLQHIENLCEEQIDIFESLKLAISEGQISGLSQQVNLSKNALIRVRDIISHIERIQQHINRLNQVMKSAIDLHFSAIANQTNENMRILAIITVIFLPLTLLTGLYGMNFQVMPGADNPNGFWLMLGAMFLSTIVLMYLFRRQRLMGTSQYSIVELLSSDDDIFDLKKLR
ncbi:MULTISPECIES: CorA family divalent cation transporter [unclassified Acinetobacter]|uniref:CorA family divalent cation transporter n=1 Tax=unclassified Acinetobacter TaxID=196816 RepID=UPI0035BB35DF